MLATRLDVRKLDLRRLDLPLFDRTELPVHADRVGRLARDTASASCGVAVIGVRTLDGRRRELTDQLTARVRRVVDAGA